MNKRNSNVKKDFKEQPEKKKDNAENKKKLRNKKGLQS